MRRTGDVGSVTLELALLGPALLLVLGLVVVAARIESAAGAVEQAAAAGARAASLARSASAAESAAEQAVRRNLSGQDVACGDLRIGVDTGGFRRPVGVDAAVQVDVQCTISLADHAIPGVPGTRRVVATVVSPLDRYRGR